MAAHEENQEKAKTTPLRNEAQLNCVSLRSELDCAVSCGAVKGQDERPLRGALDSPATHHRTSIPTSKNKLRRAATSALTPSSRTPLLGPGPLRTGRETFVLIRLKPFERLFQGDAVSIRIAVRGQPCLRTLAEAEHGSLHS